MTQVSTFDAAQADLNARFTYAADTGDVWSILKGDGPIEGDCEDYALTLIWLAEGRSMWRFWWALISFKYVMWHGLSPRGRGHLILWVRGRGWTDSDHRRVVGRKDLRAKGYKLRLPYLFFLVAAKFLLRSIKRRI